MNNRKLFQLTDTFFLHLNDDIKEYFFKGRTVNPLKIISISSSFKKLIIKDEDLLVLYSSEKNLNEVDVVVTSKYVHFKDEKLSIEKDIFLSEKFKHFSTRHLQELNKLVNDFVLVNKDQKKDLEYFTNKFKDYVNQKESANKDLEVDYKFIQVLKNEGEKLKNLVQDLNSNKHFSNIINNIIKKSDGAIEFKAEHIILQDIVKIYNKISPLNDPKNEASQLRIKFLLAFLFEKLQGNDLISSLSIQKINEFVKSDKFNENIEVIKKAKLFDLGKDYSNEYLLPLLLKRMKSNHFANSAVLLYRIASLIVKADGTISLEEEKILKEINEKSMHPKENLEGVTQTEVDENETLIDVLDELNELIGLDNIKTAVTELSNFLKVQKLREEQGLKLVNNSLHSVFMGPPGTGKTTVARLVSKIYKHLGYLHKGHLVETDRSGLVAGYVGQTALKVDQVVNASLNGVLFVDEAYSLTTGNSKDFGNEAVETILKKMEDYRKELVVIVAGYPDEMKNFINSNPGLQSRFNRYFTFEHYKPKELIGIFKLFCKKNDFVLALEAEEKLEFIFEKLYEQRHKNFGNARVARNLFEKIIEYQANRIVRITPLNKELLTTIVEEDIPPINKTVEYYLAFKEEK